MGTLVEIITYYTLQSWHLSDNIAIERRIAEFANQDIHHNVEFSLHSVRSRHVADTSFLSTPFTGAKVQKIIPFLKDTEVKRVQILGTNSVKRNAAVLLENDENLVVANIGNSRCEIIVCQLVPSPSAVVECKRVGVEKGQRKGPQTIEKAKQGAYVARSVSSLQKVRLRSGSFYGILENEDGSFRSGEYTKILYELIQEKHTAPGLVLTIGVVGNHGNWFTSEHQNKELRVLSQSYDWLLFLTDEGLSQFIHELLLEPNQEFNPVKDAFRASYTGKKGVNRFTKVRMDYDADQLLRQWFRDNQRMVEEWFNVISPEASSTANLRNLLRQLVAKPEFA